MLLLYHSAWILFHRTAYNRVDDQVSVDAATSIVRILDKIPPVISGACDTALVVLPSLTHSVTLAVTVCLTKILQQPHPPSWISANGGGGGGGGGTGREWSGDPLAAPMQDAKDMLRRCLDLLDGRRTISLHLHRFWKRIGEYLTLKGIHLDNDIRDAGPGSPPATLAAAAASAVVAGPPTAASTEDTLRACTVAVRSASAVSAAADASVTSTPAPARVSALSAAESTITTTDVTTAAAAESAAAAAAGEAASVGLGGATRPHFSLAAIAGLLLGDPLPDLADMLDANIFDLAGSAASWRRR
ncbi:hypothetical protein HK405_007270, partial [Cladochytrium tenue]